MVIFSSSILKKNPQNYQPKHLCYITEMLDFKEILSINSYTSDF